MSNKEICLQLWRDDYWPLIEDLLATYPELVQLVTSFIDDNRSRYQERLADEELMTYLKRRQFKIATIVQLMLSCGHSQSNHVLKTIKSVVTMKQRLRRRRWEEEVASGSIYSLAPTRKLVKTLTELCPHRVEQPTPYLKLFSADQYHLYRAGKKTRKHRAVERCDEDGNVVKCQSICVLNIIDYPIDNALLGLTMEEVDDIRTNGPYTEHPRLVLDELDYDKCLETLHDMFEEDMQLVADNCDEYSLDSIFILCARPAWDPKGVTVHHILRPIADCDTATYDDINKFGSRCIEEAPDAVAILCDLDGQGVEMVANAKTIKADKYQHVVPVVAAMHKDAHVVIYAPIQCIYPCILALMKEEMGFERIEERPTNLDKDRYETHRKLLLNLGMAASHVLILRYGIAACCNSRRLSEVISLSHCVG